MIQQLFLECGRNWGKTDFITYLFWRIANLNPGSENYYFTPLQTQGREIIWKSNRLQNFGPQDWIADINNTEMRITFKNGSFVKVDGSDNVDKYRGVKMTKGGLLAFDEYKDFRADFYGIIDPNLINALLLIVGTPPETDSHFTIDADEFAANPKKGYFNQPSERNTMLPPGFLANKKAELYSKNEGVLWEREYMARRVKGGKASVFPQSASIELRSQRSILRHLYRDRKKLNWHCIADPGTNSCFAVHFIAVNPYTKQIWSLQTIYETDAGKTAVSQLGPRIIEIRNSLAADVEWIYTADEAAAWFITEMYDQWGVSFAPSKKSDNAKETGISLMKDIMLAGLLEIAEDPDWTDTNTDKADRNRFLWELQNYITVKGKIPKGRDHLIDTFRYFLGAEGYSLKAEDEHVKTTNPDLRGYTMEQDHPELQDYDEEITW